MGRSQSFASAPPDSTPCSDSPSLRLPPSTGLTSPDSATRRLIMQKARRHPAKGGAPTACRRTVSGTISLPCSGCFSPFPHGTGSLSVSQEYLALRDGPRGFGQGFTCPALLRVPPVPARPTRTGLSPATAPLSSGFRFACLHLMAALQPRARRNGPGLGYSPFARRYWGNHSCFLLLRVLRCFSSPGLPPANGGVPGLQPGGLPHSDTRGSMGMCPSPRIFAACRVLRRLWEPRHPPCALNHLPRARAPGVRSVFALAQK